MNSKKFWSIALQEVYDGKIDTWDFQLSYLILKGSGKCIIPQTNLISNIGFGANATHTVDSNDKLANRVASDIAFPIRHPEKVILNSRIDSFFDKNRFRYQGVTIRLINKLLRLVKFKR